MIIIILIGTIAFVAYYVFFVNIGRNKFSWLKFDHDNNLGKTNILTENANAILAKEKERSESDAAVNDIIKNSKTKKSCST